MKVKRRPRRQGPLIYALYLNAGLLLAILVALLMRGNGLGLSSAAFRALQMAPIAGGGGIFLMPAQFSINTWGCYLMDIDTQNICAYQYFPSERQLRFVAARNYREDRKLPDWNTSPDPAEIAHLVQLRKSDIRGATQSGSTGFPQTGDSPPGPAPDSASPPGLVPTDPPVPAPDSGLPVGPGTPSAPVTAPVVPSTPNRTTDLTKPADEKAAPGQPATKGQ